MTLLLDSHVWLWWLMDDASLAPATRRVIANGGDEVLISAASLWELTIKRSTGKLRLPCSLRDLVAACGFHVLPIDARHAEQVGTLPWHHRDPFDRMLVAQAQIDALTIVTRDPEIQRYEVATLPA